MSGGAPEELIGGCPVVQGLGDRCEDVWVVGCLDECGRVGVACREAQGLLHEDEESDAGVSGGLEGPLNHGEESRPLLEGDFVPAAQFS